MLDRLLVPARLAQRLRQRDARLGARGVEPHRLLEPRHRACRARRSGEGRGPSGGARSGCPGPRAARRRTRATAAAASPRRRCRSPSVSSARSRLPSLGSRSPSAGGSALAAPPDTYPSASSRARASGSIAAGAAAGSVCAASSSRASALASDGRSPIRFLVSPGSTARSYSSGRGAAMSFRPAVPDRLQRRPAVRVPRLEGLDVGGLGHRGAARERRAQAHAVDGRRGRNPQQVEHGRRDVDQPRRRRARAGGDASGPAEEQGDHHRAVVDEEAVGPLAVLAEALAVVRGEDDERVVARAERRGQPADGGVHVRDLAVVGAAGAGAAGARRAARTGNAGRRSEPRRTAARGRWPASAARRRGSRPPAARGRRRCRGTARRRTRRSRGRGRTRSRAGIRSRRRRSRTRAPSSASASVRGPGGTTWPLSRSPRRRGKRPVMSAACDGQRERDGRYRAGEPEGIAGEAVDLRRGVASRHPPERVRPQGVDGDEEDVRRGSGASASARAPGRASASAWRRPRSRSRRRPPRRGRGGAGARRGTALGISAGIRAAAGPRRHRSRPRRARRARGGRGRHRARPCRASRRPRCSDARGLPRPRSIACRVALRGVAQPPRLFRRLAPHPPGGGELGDQLRRLAPVALGLRRPRPRPARPGRGARTPRRSASPPAPRAAGWRAPPRPCPRARRSPRGPSRPRRIAGRGSTSARTRPGPLRCGRARSTRRRGGGGGNRAAGSGRSRA